MIKTTTREPGKAPQPLCSNKGHYGIFHNTDTDNIECTGCGRVWIPRELTGPTPTTPTDPTWTSAWLDKPRPTTPPSNP